MLIDYEFLNSSLICSYVNDKGNIKLKHFPWKRPSKFITTSDHDPEKSGKWVTWSGKPVKEIYTRNPNKFSIYDFIENLPDEEKDVLFEYNEPNAYFIDIETEILDEKLEPHLAKSMVLSIAIVHKDKALVMGFDPLKKEEIQEIEDDINEKYGKQLDRKWNFQYKCYKSEYDMLYNFFKGFVPNMSLISGWNVIGFDWVFLVNRYRNIGGDPSVASFTGKLQESWKDNDYSEMPKHRLIVDYMELYKKWDTFVKVKESNALDFVAGAVLGEKFGKVSYTGDLKYLYKTDKKKFMFYNVIDSILVQLLHERTRYVDTLYGISQLAHCTVNNAFSTMAQVEGLLRTKLRKQKNIILCKDDTNESAVAGSVSGGFVLPPLKGMATWTCCYDFASLYPTTIRLLNISADSYKGQMPLKKGEIDYQSEFSIFNGHQIRLDKDDIILLNGSVFKNEEGVVSQVMREVYADRKKYKNIMMKEHVEMEALKNERKEKALDPGTTNEFLKNLDKIIKDKDALYNQAKAMQLGLKTVINGTYGAFAHPKFVVSNKHIANAITIHGRDVILYMLNNIENYFYNDWHKDTTIHNLLKETYIGIDSEFNSYMLNNRDEIVYYPEKYDEKFKDSDDSEKEKSCVFNLLKSWKINPNRIKKIDDRVVNIKGKEITIRYIRKLHNFKNLTQIDGTVIGDREKMDNHDTKFHKEEIIVYGDTDSLYMTYAPIMNSCDFDNDGLEFILSLDRLFIKSKFTKWLDEYADKYKVDNIHDFELETVNKSSLHVQKKHYINNVVWEDGIFFNDMEHFIPKGVEIVKSSTPPFVRGKKQKGGVWEFIEYLFRNPDSMNSREILRIVKKLKSQFILADIEDISFTTSLTNYSDRVVDDQNGVECVKGAHFSIKAGALHNYLLNKHGKYKTKYDLLKGGRIKWYYIKDYPLNDRMAYLRSFHPYEILEKEKIEIDYDRQFFEAFLKICNRFIKTIGLPEINKRLGVLNSLFDGENLGDVLINNKQSGSTDLDLLEDWDDDFDF
jgi:DNA polymerase elongation subunit (family B)